MLARTEAVVLMQGASSEARVFIETSEKLTMDKVARAIGCARPQLSKYLTGTRPVSSVMRSKLEREFGTDGVTLINLCNTAHREKDNSDTANEDSKKLRSTPAYRELFRRGLTHEDFVARMSLHRRRSLRILTGSLELTDEHRAFVLSEWGENLVAAIDKSRALFIEQRDKPTSNTDLVAESYDGPWFTISEWRAEFGEPGCSSKFDPFGRIEGVFQTEPCFLGE
jgi:hypothetical protein